MFRAGSSGPNLVLEVSGADGSMRISLDNSAFESHLDGLSMVMWKEDCTLQWTSLSLVGMLVGCEIGQFNCLGSVLPIGILTELCNDCLTISNLEIFFRIFENIHTNTIHVSNCKITNNDTIRIEGDGTVDHVLETLRNQLLELRIVSKLDKANISCMIASWLSNCQAINSDLIMDEGIQNIVERIQLLSTSESTIEDYIKTDTSLLLDAKINLLNAIRKKPEEVHKDKNSLDISSQLWILLALAEVFKTTAVFEYCVYLLYTWLVIDGKDGKITKTIKALNLSDDENLNIQNKLKHYFSTHVPTNPLRRSSEEPPDTSARTSMPNSQQRIDYSTYSISAVPPVIHNVDVSDKSVVTAPATSVKNISDAMKVDIISSINRFYEIYPTITSNTASIDSDLIEPSLSIPLPIPEPYPSNPVISNSYQQSAMKINNNRYSINKDKDDAIRPVRSTSPTSYITPTKTTSVSNANSHRDDEDSVIKDPPKGNLYDRNGRFIGHKSREIRVSFSEPFSRVRSSTPSSSMKTPTKDTRTSINSSYSDPVEGRLRAVERLQDVKRRQNYENTKLAVEESMRLSRLKSVELRAIMARVGYGHNTPSNSSSKRTGSIFHRIRVSNDNDKDAPTIKVDSNSNSPDTALIAQRRAQERIRQHKLEMERKKESELKTKKEKELLKWQERDRKIQLFLERQAAVSAAESSSVKVKNLKYGVSEPWNHGSPWMLRDPNKQAMEKKSHSIDALRSVGLAPLDDTESYDSDQQGRTFHETRTNTMTYDNDDLTIEDNDNSVHFYEHIQYDPDDVQSHNMKVTSRGGKSSVNTLFSPTSVVDAISDRRPTDYIVSVNILKAWNLPTDLLGSTNPYVVLDWGIYGRACSFAIMNSTQPNYNCVVQFRSPLETASPKELESGSHQHLVYVNGRPYNIPPSIPIMKAYVYSRNESISDELLGEGEVNMGKVLLKVYSRREKANEAGSKCVLNLYDMSSQFTGSLELSVGIKEYE